MTIKKRFYLLIGLVVVTMLVMLSMSRYNTSSIVALERVEVRLVEATADMLMLRRNEKDFLARKDMKYLDKFNGNHEALIRKVQELAAWLEHSGIDASKAGQLAGVLEDYAGDFRTLVKTQQQIGLHSKDGLYGSLREAVHGVESLVKEAGEYRLLSDMLMLRRNEKDFMLRDDLKYLGKFDKNIGTFAATLTASTISPEVKQ